MRQRTREFSQEALRLLEYSSSLASLIETRLGIGDGCLMRWHKGGPLNRWTDCAMMKPPKFHPELVALQGVDHDH